MKSRYATFGSALVVGALVGFGAMANVAANGPTLTAIEQLGKSIFFDENLSLNANQSCATCHAPEVGWTGPHEAINMHGAVYEGSVPGAFGDRKPPSSAYATLSPVLHMDEKGRWIGGNFWDGRATGERLGNPAADQAQGPFLNPKEQALPDPACVVYRVCMASYPVSFEGVWGVGSCGITWPSDVETACGNPGGFVSLSLDERTKVYQNYDAIAYSIAAFEASPESNAFTSKFDLAMKGRAKLTKEEQLGRAIFNGRGNCAKCHVSRGQKPVFTDFTYDNVGVPKNPENPATLADPTFIDAGLGGFLESAGYEEAVYMANWGKHKVPTLRNVDLRPDPSFVKAYGHNGYFKSLRGIVHFYNTRDVLPACPGAYTEAEALAANCWPEPEVMETVNTAETGHLGLTTAEEQAIVAFLETLSDGSQPSRR